MSAPREIIDLIDRFERNADDYRSRYGETEVRNEFINPFFKCLGWDIYNSLGFGEAYKDVIHEDAVKVGGVTKAPDYCFRVGGTRKFFLEAKRPSVNLKTDPVPAFQLRRYAWSAGLPLSILTDFEEFAVYDCRVKPAQTDKAATARIRYLTFTDYPDQWDTIADTFSKDAVLKGSFDRYAESNKVKRGTARFDAEFLKEIEGWRELLAKNIAKNNAARSQRELNYAVQTTIDRILFLRMCEDRGIEQYGQLLALRNGTAVYGRLKELFRKADERYNSGLFHFTREHDRAEPPDELTTALTIDDKPLKDIFKTLYYPDSPYEFSVLPAEILGQVYEQFLGKVICLSGNHRATVEEKPEVRKAGGVYYTPTYIVDYIVKNTVGKLLEGKTPKQASKLKILDPACGSGSFLLVAYQFMLDWHRERYLEEGAEKHPKELFKGRRDSWHLTSAERKRILLNNIYGVDIDPQAVEVTKLSLLLKVLEGESQQALERQLRLFHERALPDLANNIKCGNSLIGPDFYDGQQQFDFAEEERYRINVFDWNAEFPAIMKAGGFDAVIGNPPYIGFHGFADQKEYLRVRYLSARGKFDIYLPFIERSIQVLRADGLLGFICPTNFMKRGHGEELRGHLKDKIRILEITDFQDVQVFEGATNYTGVFLLSKSKPSVGHRLRYKTRDLANGYFEVNQQYLTAGPWIFRDSTVEAIVAKIRCAHVSLLGSLTAGVSEGIVTGQNDVFLLSKSKAEEMKLESELLRPCIRGRQIRRYFLDNVDEVVIYPYRLSQQATGALSESELRQYSRVWNYLQMRRSDLKGRGYFESSSKHWYELWCQRRLDLLAVRKIVVPELAESNRFAFADETSFYGDTVCGIVLLPEIPEHVNYFLGLLNSRLLEFFYKATTVPKANAYYIYKTMFLKQMPIRRIDFNVADDKARHDRIVELVSCMLGIQKSLAGSRIPHDRNVVQGQISALDTQIEDLVCELYGISDGDDRVAMQPNKRFHDVPVAGC